MSDFPANPYNQPLPEVTFSPEEPPKSRGCLFYGCLTALILALLALIFTAVAIYMAYHWVDRNIKAYTSTTPIVLPEVKLPEAERKAIQDRWKTFKAAVEKGEAAELTLDADEVNSLIDDQPDFKGKFYVTIKGDKISAKMSVPIDALPFGLGKGRYLNGSATITISLREGDLVVHARQFEVNGKSPPPEFMGQFANENLAKNFTSNPQNREMIAKLKSIQVKDGKILIKSKVPSASEDEPETDEIKDKPKDADDMPKDKPKDADDMPKEKPSSADDMPKDEEK